MNILAILFLSWCSGSIARSEPPGSYLDLSSWRLTLPVDTERAETPDEVSLPELSSFSDERYFYFDASTGGVVFRAHCGGETTRGSDYPRCELREMTRDGAEQAAWNTDDNAVHVMTMKAAITETPAAKRHVVCAQIHHANDDLLMVRLEGTKLFIERNSVDRVMLNRRYELGDPFQLRIQAGRGTVNVWYNDQHSMNWQVSQNGCYFKAGCYTQSNLSHGDMADACGEVVFYELNVEHKTLD